MIETSTDSQAHEAIQHGSDLVCPAERHLDSPSTALPGGPFAGVIHQHATHHTGGQADEMGAILKSHLSHSQQLYIRFMDQRSRLQGMAGMLVAQVMGRQAVKLGVYQRGKFPQRLLVPVTPCLQQHGDAFRPRHELGLKFTRILCVRAVGFRAGNTTSRYNGQLPGPVRRHGDWAGRRHAVCSSAQAAAGERRPPR